MVNCKMCIQDLLRHINKCMGGLYGYICFRRYLKDGSYIQQHYYYGKVNEQILILFLKKSILLPYLQWLFPDIFMMIDASSITDRVLNACMKYPGKFRSTLLMLLGHMQLNIAQLERLNDQMETPEAFYKLFNAYLQSKYASGEMEAFLKKNIRFRYELPTCCSLLIKDSKKIDSNKLEIIRRFINDPNDQEPIRDRFSE